MFTMTVETDNTVFDDGMWPLIDILRGVGEGLAGGIMSATLRDENGNTIGSYTLTPRKPVTEPERPRCPHCQMMLIDGVCPDEDENQEHGA